MSNLKSNSGLTLMGLVVYIIIILIVIGVMVTIRDYFFKNINTINNQSRFAVEFDKFNATFLKDVKKSEDVLVEDKDGDTYITFDNGTVYKYNSKDKSIYRNSVRISQEVDVFEVAKKSEINNNMEKNVLEVFITIGNNDRNLLNKFIDYTLRYW